MPRPLANDGDSVSRTPDRGDPDRKRALNVLAQRRYRLRKRERLAALEAGARSLEAASAESEVIDADTHRIVFLSSESHSPDRCDNDTAVFTRIPPLLPSSSGSQHLENAGPTITSPETSFNDDRSYQSFDPAFQLFSGGLSLPDTALPWEEMPLNLEEADSQYEELTGSIFSCPGSGNQQLNFPLVGCPGSISTWSGTRSASTTSYSEPALSSELELNIPVLKTMRVGLTIIQMLGGLEQVYDVSARWTMGNGDFSCLPPSFQPTTIQLSVPHHPMLDVIPWSSLRDKLILMYAMPPALRPKTARDDTASLMQLAHDYEDPAEPFVVNGPDGWSEDEWEMGGAFFKNWWWAIDQEIITKTNAQRVRRGASRLRLASNT